MIKKITLDLNITSANAFKMLLETLDMEWAMNDDRDFYTTEENEFGDLVVYEKLKDGTSKSVDDRGELFHTLRKLATLIFPNLSWRGDYK